MLQFTNALQKLNNLKTSSYKSKRIKLIASLVMSDNYVKDLVWTLLSHITRRIGVSRGWDNPRPFHVKGKAKAECLLL